VTIAHPTSKVRISNAVTKNAEYTFNKYIKKGTNIFMSESPRKSCVWNNWTEHWISKNMVSFDAYSQ